MAKTTPKAKRRLGMLLGAPIEGGRFTAKPTPAAMETSAEHRKRRKLRWLPAPMLTPK